jgi:hypothetical protein
MFVFKIRRPKAQLEQIKTHFNNHRNYFVDTHDHYFHVSDVQIYQIELPSGDFQHAGITSWPQFLPAIIPPVDYILIAHTDQTGTHAHIGRLRDVLDVLRHFGYTQFREPVTHYCLPHILDDRWRKQVLKSMVRVDSE